MENTTSRDKEIKFSFVDSGAFRKYRGFFTSSEEPSCNILSTGKTKEKGLIPSPSFKVGDKEVTVSLETEEDEWYFINNVIPFLDREKGDELMEIIRKRKVRREIEYLFFLAIRAVDDFTPNELAGKWKPTERIKDLDSFLIGYSMAFLPTLELKHEYTDRPRSEQLKFLNALTTIMTDPNVWGDKIEKFKGGSNE